MNISDIFLTEIITWMTAKGNKEISINLKKVKTIINDIYNSLFKFQCEIIYFAFLLPLL